MSANRPRILILAHDVDDSGGMERALTELIRRGSSQVDFTVVSTTLSPELASLVEWRRLRVPRRPFPLKFAVFFLLAGLVRTCGVDLVHTCGAIAPRRADLVSIHFCHAGYRTKTGGLSPSGGPITRRVNTLISRTMALGAERLCYRPALSRQLACVSHGVQNEIRAAYPGVTTAITPNGVDTHRFRPDVATRKLLRTAEKVDEQAQVAVFVGGDWNRKGLGLAIASIAVANRDRSEARTRLWVVGPGDRDRYLQLARRFGVDGDVRFFGRRADTEVFYQAADVLLFPTLYEAFPLVALEAAACGVPVVGPRVNGVVDLVVEGGGGLIVDRTPEAFALALLKLAEDTNLARRLGANGAAWVSGFTWERSVASVLAIYDDLLAESGAGRTAAGRDRS